MATLKQHQEAMVQLLANGNGIPASASRLAHAMHDVLSAMLSEPDLIRKALAESDAIRRAVATTPGLNDRALSKREKALKTDSPAKWPAPAEQRVKELENTIRQLKANNAKLKAESARLRDANDALREYRDVLLTEQAGCRKEDTQVCEPECDHAYAHINMQDRTLECGRCGHNVPWPAGFDPSKVS